MPTIYVAKSKGLAGWGADVGLTKHVYKLGVTDLTAEAAVKALNDAAVAGHADWKLVKKAAVETLDEESAIATLGRKQRLVEPGYYPGIKGARGIFKIKPAIVEEADLMKQALANEQMKNVKLNAAAIADYMIRNAQA